MVTDENPQFLSHRAMQDIEKQINLGPRIPGSLAHIKTREYIINELAKAGWTVTTQKFISLGHEGYNLFATRNSSKPAILLGAHYDSRLFADKDPNLEKTVTAVPGANDGSSGVAVLLEIGRVLPSTTSSVGLVFFDLEDNGHIDGWDWILGSRAFVDKIEYVPQAVVVVDMVGKPDSLFYYEGNSNEALNKQIWSVASKLGFSNTFVAEPGLTILDDHVPFLAKNIPAVDIIDLDYAYWHTSEDTLDKISANSLKIVGDTLLYWIENYSSCIEKENCS